MGARNIAVYVRLMESDENPDVEGMKVNRYLYLCIYQFDLVLIYSSYSYMVVILPQSIGYLWKEWM